MTAVQLQAMLDDTESLETLRKTRRGKTVSPVFPATNPAENVEKKQVRLQRRTWDRLKEIGREQQPKKSMNAVIEFFLDWAIQDYDLAKANSKKAKK